MQTIKTGIDFSHRFSYSKNDVLDPDTLCDTINMMTERALGVLSAMGELAVNHKMDSLPAPVWHSLFFTISNELHDIDAVIAAFNHAENTKERG